MSYHFIGFNTNYMFGFGGCCNRFMPFVPYSFNYFYNPFAVFNTAMQIMSNGFESVFKTPQPMFTQTFTPIIMPSWNNNNSNLQNYNSLYDGVGFYTPKAYSIANPGVYAIPQITETPRFDDLKDLTYGSGIGNSYSFSSSKVPGSTYKPSYTTLSANYLNKDFLAKVKQVAKNINCDYQDLLAVMNSESGLQPNKWNSSKSAVGLIQFTDPALADLKRVYGINLTKEQVSKMSAIEQLDLAEKFYKITTQKFGGKKLRAADLYASTYLPCRATNEVLCRKGERNSDGSLKSYYESNTGLDVNGDGMITKEDLAKRLAKKRVNLDTFA